MSALLHASRRLGGRAQLLALYAGTPRPRRGYATYDKIVGAAHTLCNVY